MPTLLTLMIGNGIARIMNMHLVWNALVRGRYFNRDGDVQQEDGIIYLPLYMTPLL